MSSVAATASAQEAAKAKAEYREGSKLYNLSEYQAALEKFKTAYLLQPDPVFLFNIAQCQRQLQQWEAAQKSYRAFLRESPNLPNKVRDEVTKLSADMDQAVREERMKRPPTETRPPDTTPQKEEPPPPPKPEVVVTPPPPPPAPPRPWYKNGAGMALTFGGLVVAAVGGGLLGGAAAATSNARGANSLPDQNHFLDQSVGYQGGGYALLGVGGAALITGVVLLGLPARQQPAVKEASR